MVKLVPMSEAEFATFYEAAIQDYAQDKVTVGTWSEDQALALSQQAFRELLPQGLATPDQHLFTIWTAEAPETSSGITTSWAEAGNTDAGRIAVGVLWFGLNDFGAGRVAFLYNFEIFEPFRRRGYGALALEALDEKVRELGLTTITLHVFGYNLAARHLYEKMGYAITDISMAKTLKPLHSTTV